jgi:beta-mannosidase
VTSYRPLGEGWVLAPAEDGHGEGVPAAVRARPVPASVPGWVHTDLLAAGLVPDPYLDDNEARLGWIGHTDWLYRRTTSTRTAGARTRPGAPTGSSGMCGRPPASASR